MSNPGYQITNHKIRDDDNSPLFAIVYDENGKELFTFDEVIIDGERVVTVRFDGFRSMNTYTGHSALTFFVKEKS